MHINEVLAGKRVAIVGPADSAFKQAQGDYIDSFDIIIRLNKAPFVLQEEKNRLYIGSRTNILFHSFFENETFGGGRIDIPLYKSLGIEYLVNPLSNLFGLRNTLNFYKKYLLKYPVYFLSRQQFRYISTVFKNIRPTTGFCALYSVINSDFQELYITGFTFFKTNYAAGYRSSLEKVETARMTIDQMKIHNADFEFEQFVMLLQENHRKNILMDPVLNEIVSTHKSN